MTVGNQGAAYDRARAALDKDPGNPQLKRDVEEARKALNQSHDRSNTGNYYK